MRWFFGFKLRLIRNGRDELLNFMLTPDDVNSSKSIEYMEFI